MNFKIFIKNVSFNVSNEWDTYSKEEQFTSLTWYKAKQDPRGGVLLQWCMKIWKQQMSKWQGLTGGNWGLAETTTSQTGVLKSETQMRKDNLLEPPPLYFGHPPSLLCTYWAGCSASEIIPHTSPHTCCSHFKQTEPRCTYLPHVGTYFLPQPPTCYQEPNPVYSLFSCLLLLSIFITITPPKPPSPFGQICNITLNGSCDTVKYMWLSLVTLGNWFQDPPIDIRFTNVQNQKRICV